MNRRLCTTLWFLQKEDFVKSKNKNILTKHRALTQDGWLSLEWEGFSGCVPPEQSQMPGTVGEGSAWLSFRVNRGKLWFGRGPKKMQSQGLWCKQVTSRAQTNTSADPGGRCVNVSFTLRLWVRSVLYPCRLTEVKKKKSILVRNIHLSDFLL